MLVTAAQEWGSLVAGFGDELGAALPIAFKAVAGVLAVYVTYRVFMKIITKPF